MIAFLSTILLLIPVYIMIKIQLSLTQLATLVLAFSFIFAAALSALTDARWQDVFAATATYCAVLVVFLGNLQQIQLKASDTFKI